MPPPDRYGKSKISKLVFFENSEIISIRKILNDNREDVDKVMTAGIDGPNRKVRRSAHINVSIDWIPLKALGL